MKTRSMVGRRSSHAPVRTCISCGSKRSKGSLLRLVLDEEGRVIKDELGTKPGRGAYVCGDTACMEKLPKGRLERALRCKFLRYGAPTSSKKTSRGS